MSTYLQTALAKRSMKLADLARAAGVNKSTATRWSKKSVPAEKILVIEGLTGIPRHELRPDLYPPTREVAA
jgi:DNA-binding transcriptional regulator YdaS (Cro superfamily)